jgi:hypothetical protein
MSLDLSFGRLEERGMQRKEQLSSHKSIPPPLSALEVSHQEPSESCRAQYRHLEGDLTLRIIC